MIGVNPEFLVKIGFADGVREDPLCIIIKWYIHTMGIRDCHLRQGRHFKDSAHVLL